MLKIKKNDTVMVTAGKNKGATGKVLLVIPEKDRVIVEKVNMVTRHMKPRQGGQKGERIQKEGSLHISNVMLIDPESKKPTRVGFELKDTGNGKMEKIRVAAKSRKEIK